MTFVEFCNAVDGLLAYDTGSTDSGIHDERLRAEVSKVLEGPDGLKWLARFARDAFLSEEAMAKGYGLEDVAGLIRWLSEYMDFDL